MFISIIVANLLPVVVNTTLLSIVVNAILHGRSKKFLKEKKTIVMTKIQCPTTMKLVRLLKFPNISCYVYAQSTLKGLGFAYLYLRIWNQKGQLVDYL